MRNFTFNCYLVPQFGLLVSLDDYETATILVIDLFFLKLKWVWIRAEEEVK